MRSFLIGLGLALVASACAPGIYIDREHRLQQGEQPPPADEISYRAFLIGDAGYVSEPVLRLLEARLDEAGEDGVVVFLGDNIYPAGLPDSADAGRAEAERLLRAQLDAVRDFPGRIVFVPGNHDWNDSQPGGLEAVLRQEQFVEAYLDRGNVFLPDEGFPGPVEVELTDRITLIALDTEWWLTEQDRPFGDTDDYELEETGDFLLQLDDVLKRNRDNDMLIVGHHPLFSNGKHAGRAPLREHIFPLTATGAPLYLPLPAVGSLYPLYRRYIGGPQDLAHPRYASLRRNLVDLFDSSQDYFIVYAGGHEHNLQYFEAPHDNHFIVSGGGSRDAYVGGGGQAAFTAYRVGFAVLNYYRDGAVWVEFWSPNEDGSRGELLFRTELRGAVSELVDPEVPTAAAYPDYTDSTRVAVANPGYQGGATKEFFLGKHHREAWATPIEVPVLDMGRTAGGLTPVKRGGGMQTLSLRLAGADGNEYVLRSIDKDPTKTVPENLQGSVATDIVQDQIAAIHPYGAFIVPKLARAAGVYHTNPQLVFVPDDPRLGIYRETFGNQLMMFEDRPDDDMSHQPSYGNAREVISAHKLYREVTDDNDHRVDQRAFVRVRLFDIFLSDWDRHRDQWRWAAFEPYELDPTLEGDARTQGKIYRPIPRDRDWAFNRMDGLLLSIYKQLDPRFQSFHDDYGYLRGFTINGGDQDRRFTSALSREDWIAAADSIRLGLTDEVIEEAVRSWPASIVDLQGEEFVRLLKIRRDLLPKTAERMYALYAAKVDVVGSNKHERFEVERLDDRQTRVVVYKTDKGGEIEKEIYRRTFYRDETEEIRLYGLDGDDRFVVTGAVEQGLLVIAVGGPGEDTFVDHSDVRAGSRKTRFYDSRTGNDWETGPETRVVRSDDPSVNRYDQEPYRPDLLLPKTFFGRNNDDGLFIGGGVQKISQGFRKVPFATSHTFLGNFAARTLAFNLRYEGLFIEALGAWDVGLDLTYDSPNNIRNFYGLGNETTSDEEDRQFYQARLSNIHVLPYLRRYIEPALTFRIGPTFEYTLVREDEDRFVAQTGAGVAEGTFENQWFAGLNAEVSLGSVDSRVFPRQGVEWTSRVDLNLGLVEQSESFAALASAFSFYLTPARLSNWTLAARAGVEHNVGDFPFFFASTLGGKSNLRGYRGTRFAGRTSFYQNVDLRVKLFDFATYVAVGEFGALGFFDNGRVWVDNEDSDVWHKGVGGGAWASFFDVVVLSSTLGFSDDDRTFTLKFGFLF